MKWDWAMTPTCLISYAFIAISTVAAPPAQEPPDENAFFEQVYRLQQAQEALVPELVRIASSRSHLHIDRQNAIMSLGKVRNLSAIAALVDNLLVPAATISEIHSTSLYPAATCLREIGSPIYPHIWNRLNHDCSAEYLHVLGLTVTGFDGKAISITRVKERQNSRGISDQQKENLQKLLNLLETVDFDDFKNWRSQLQLKPVQVDR
jgi:hypothetical protein